MTTTTADRQDQAAGASTGGGAVPTARGRRRGRHHWRRRRKEYALFLLMISPNLLIIGTFDYWPVIYNAWLSLTRWNMLSGTPRYVGLQNYENLFNSSSFHGILWNTLTFSAAIVIGSVILGLAVALLFDQKLRGRGIVRTAAFAPHIVSGAAVATLWLFIFDPAYGLTRVVLDPFGVASPRWVNDADWAMIALIIAYLWKGLGFVAIVYLAGLQNLPEELYEAAKLDGAGTWTTFRRITLPLLSPVTFFVLVTSIIGTFQAYDMIAVLTGGGPGDATTTLSWYVYQQGFRASDAGTAAAAAMLLFFILLLVTGLQTRFVQRKVHYT
ncbi:carbohydrate ABC transporter permease [Jiangella sp. DSM 45060]|uniref:carbohydrate ABC transporter permease n=1 Tax=Jiangella sp. DSM 45060 TaxID=1798224 RepID=UPI0008796D42|nr:sugar ABC transporter permease [Jiangella sp. DSM 45060]SDT48919.1 carbohydrate ABC transporter membrane protein 1, CUT1 family [Jiangella sp. DSM 45060]